MGDISLNLQKPQVITHVPIVTPEVKLSGKIDADKLNQQLESAKNEYINRQSNRYLAAYGIQAATDQLSDKITGAFGDSQLGQNLATMFSTGLNSTGNTIMNNFVKGDSLFQGLGQNVGTSLTNANSPSSLRPNRRI